MMGRGLGGQKPLFYSFNLDDHVPADHLLRGIDRCLDLGDLRSAPPVSLFRWASEAINYGSAGFYQ